MKEKLGEVFFARNAHRSPLGSWHLLARLPVTEKTALRSFFSFFFGRWETPNDGHRWEFLLLFLPAGKNNGESGEGGARTSLIVWPWKAEMECWSCICGFCSQLFKFVSGLATPFSFCTPFTLYSKGLLEDLIFLCSGILCTTCLFSFDDNW